MRLGQPNLVGKPGGLQNKAGMYTEHELPGIANPESIHSIQIYLLSGLNAMLLSGSLGTAWYGENLHSGIVLVIGLFIGFLVAQILGVMWYWRKKEKHAGGASGASGGGSRR